ncbi:MAG: hypothetical protein HPY54_01890 [Chthonomonadetes bacterium]|nr:hypothetical protein [Chthonomonadetes bacterium]
MASTDWRKRVVIDPEICRGKQEEGMEIDESGETVVGSSGSACWICGDMDTAP